MWISNLILGINLYPNYGHNIIEAKKRCYPDNIQVIELEATVNSQSLLDHTVSRLLLTVETEHIPHKCIVFYKWGFDGSSGHSEYKQIFKCTEDSDSTVVTTTMVSIRIIADDESRAIIWQNPVPSSTRLEILFIII